MDGRLPLAHIQKHHLHFRCVLLHPLSYGERWVLQSCGGSGSLSALVFPVRFGGTDILYSHAGLWKAPVELAPLHMTSLCSHLCQACPPCPCCQNTGSRHEQHIGITSQVTGDPELKGCFKRSHWDMVFSLFVCVDL